MVEYIKFIVPAAPITNTVWRGRCQPSFYFWVTMDTYSTVSSSRLLGPNDMIAVQAETNYRGAETLVIRVVHVYVSALVHPARPGRFL
jgi:hypothetical protein